MFFKYTWPAIVWTGIILILTGIPGNYIPHVSSFWESINPDKLVHLFLFAVLMFFLLYGFHRQFTFPRLQSAYLLVAWLISAPLGILTEVLQHYVFIGRNGSIYDFLADLVGCLGGMIAFIGVKKKLLMRK